MSRRLTGNIVRPEPVSIVINGAAVTAYEGETVATALLAAGIIGTVRDAAGRVRGPFCNMGICCDCMVSIEEAGGPPVRVKSCLARVRAGLRVTVPEQRAGPS